MILIYRLDISRISNAVMQFLSIRPTSLVWSLIVSFVLLIFPFINILHYVLPLPQLFNKSAWLVMPVGMLVIIYLWVDRPWVGKFSLSFRLLLAPMAIFLVILIIRSLNYDEPVLQTNLRFALTMITYLGLAKFLVKQNNSAASILIRVLVLQGLLVAVLVFINFNFFPSLSLYNYETGQEGLNTRTSILTRTMLINASIGSNQIICAIFSLYVFFRYECKKSARSWIVFWFAMFFLAFIILLLGSRYAIIFSWIVLLIAAFQLRSTRSFISMMFALLILILINAGVINIQRMLIESKIYTASSIQIAKPSFRFQQDSGSRMEKALLAIRILSSSTINFVIGPSLQELDESTTDQNVKFSDNSFLMLMLLVGVPAAIFFFAVWLWHLMRFARVPLTLFFISYFSGVLMLTNGILWEPWLCLFIFTLITIDTYSDRTYFKD